MSGFKEIIQRIIEDREAADLDTKKKEARAEAQKKEERRQKTQACLALLDKSGAQELFDELNQEMLGGKGKISRELGFRRLTDYEEYRVSSLGVTSASLCISWALSGEEMKIIVEAMDVYESGPEIYVSAGFITLADDLHGGGAIKNGPRIKDETKMAVAQTYLYLSSKKKRSAW